MKTLFKTVFVAIVFHYQVYAQVPKPVYTKATDLTIAGDIMPTQNPYHRVDTVKYPAMPAVVKRLLTQSAGKVICFTTNSKQLTAKWCSSGSKPYPNLTPIANKGLDLYIKKDGKWQFAGVGRPDGQCTEATLVSNMADGEKECLLYLPIYDEVGNVEIGTDAGASIKPIPFPFQKRVLVYGSSITQGASASRSGLAYPARLSRLTGLNFMNLGLSGSAKMEPAVIAMINDIQADAYVLDCIPNSSDVVVKERALNMINSIRAAHPGKPIIMVNSITREAGYIDTKVGNMVNAQNAAIDSIAKNLVKQHTKDFYYIDTKGFLGDDHEGSTDGIHPNDLGSYRFVEKIEPMIADILKKYFK
ncbi:SGNH/GDSL hydrolase family protein [Mucilaginibacter mali]|uniref:SGNH/GDSL hydrolase family protein n=1 Tax=Mucilaginibacter mali TaxID=2740462 RepID=A0A7D4Q6F6_9SPHI|nr:SGNH/GDSL hydrolase family protein [Mucilaginibacter mali]QKJ28565.1 SGNH/GDSL hydrolase family protein [Mucilaginibacter mali]